MPRARTATTWAFPNDVQKRLAFGQGRGMCRKTSFSIQWFGEDRLRYLDMPEYPYNRRVTLVRIGPNSAMHDSAAGTSDLSCKLMAAPGSDTTQAYAHDPTQPMSTGTWFFLCVAAHQDGYLSIEHRSIGEADYTSLGTWRLPTGPLARAPETGTLKAAGAAGIEDLRLRHVADTATCRGSSHVVPESITIVDSRPQATAVAVSLELTCSIPDVCIDERRLPLFIAQATLRELVAGLKARATGGSAL